MKKILLLACLLSLHCFAVEKLEVKNLYKKDEYFHILLNEYIADNQQKNVTMITEANSQRGVYLWFFEKEKVEEIRNLGTSNELKVKHHNLYSHIELMDHGGSEEIAQFKDFGNDVYKPEFLYPYCVVADADNDGAPEFYLTYFGNSVGLDAKPLKVIIYSTSKPKTRDYIKSKITAYYPAGNEGDTYRVEYDANWKKLHPAIKARATGILDEIKKKKVVE